MASYGLSGLAVTAVLAVSFSSACTSLPALDKRSASRSLTDTAVTRLGRSVAPLVAKHPGASGIHPLADAHDAFAARAVMVKAAERSLDLQYDRWRDDLTGRLLFNRVLEAADRGVRVRFLLDDNNTAGMDDVLAFVDAHENIQVRLFNPFRFRTYRGLSYLTDFGRANRRMHNKSVTVDNQATVVGGRNISDEYFDAGGVPFQDVDVIAVGPVMGDVSDDFDRYWVSRSASPVRKFLPPATMESVTRG